SSPLSIVTSARSPTRWSLNSVSGIQALPDERGAHAHADAERRDAVARVRSLGECVRELGEQAHTRGRKWVPARDRSAVRIQARVLWIDAELVTPGQDLDGERLVQLEDVDLVEGQARPLERLPRGRHGAEAHQLRLDARVGVGDETHPS